MIGTIQDVISDMNHGLYNLTKDGKCTGCGQCCSNVLPLTSGEIRQIKRYIKSHGIKEQKHTFPAVLAKPVAYDMTCPFLDDSREKDKCTIYKVRPGICRCFLCSEPHGMIEYPEMFAETRIPVDMRETFFGKVKR